jgi:hypothetical protein
MKIIAPLALSAALLSACGPAGVIDSDMERALVGGAIGYGAAEAVGGKGERGAILGALGGVFCDDAGVCARPRY